MKLSTLPDRAVSKMLLAETPLDILRKAALKNISQRFFPMRNEAVQHTA
jgi:hypothetical protein